MARFACWTYRCALLIALFAAASTGATAAERPVVIGAMYNLTGGQQDLDIPSSRGARLAVDEANKKGGVLGRQVKLIVRRRRDQAEGDRARRPPAVQAASRRSPA